MTLRQLISDEYNKKKSIKTITVTNLATDEVTVIPVYQGHAYSATKRTLCYDDFHGDVVSYGRLSPRASNVDIVIAGKKKPELASEPAYAYISEYDMHMLEYATAYA